MSQPPQTPLPQEQKDDWDEWVWWAGQAVAIVAFWPLVAGWFGARKMAGRRFIWKGRRRSLVAWALLGIAVPGALVWSVLNQLLTVPNPWSEFPAWPDWKVVAVILGVWWAAQLPLGWAAARYRAGAIATDVSRGLHDPATADIVRTSIWEAAQKEASRRANDVGNDLGAVIDDDKRSPGARWTDTRNKASRKGSRWVKRDRVALPSKPPRVLLFGGSGSGKTSIIRAHVRAALIRDWRVVVIDAKGNRDDAAQIVADAGVLGVKHIVHWPTEPFDGWRGDCPTVVGKAAALLPTDSPLYYRQRSESALHAVAAMAPWRSNQELLDRLANPAPWVVNQGQLNALIAKHQGIAVHQHVHAEMTAALRGMDTMIHPDGWGWDDEQTNLVVCSVDITNPAEKLAAALMLADLNAYRNRRGPEARPMLVVIDEAAGVLDDPMAPNLAVLMEQVRSQNIGLIIGTQSVGGLGETQKERLLDAGADLLVGRMSNPDELITRAGTARVQEVAHQGLDGGHLLSGQTAAREQQQYLLDPSRVKAAPTGCFAIAEAGSNEVRWAWFRKPETHPDPWLFMPLVRDDLPAITAAAPPLPLRQMPEEEAISGAPADEQHSLEYPTQADTEWGEDDGLVEEPYNPFRTQE